MCNVLSLKNCQNLKYGTAVSHLIAILIYAITTVILRAITLTHWKRTAIRSLAFFRFYNCANRIVPSRDRRTKSSPRVYAIHGEALLYRYTGDSIDSFRFSADLLSQHFGEKISTGIWASAFSSVSLFFFSLFLYRSISPRVCINQRQSWPSRRGLKQANLGPISPRALSIL